MSSERAYREVQQRGLNALASEGKLTDSGTAPMKKSALKKKTWPGTTMMAHQEKERERALVAMPWPRPAAFLSQRNRGHP